MKIFSSSDIKNILRVLPIMLGFLLVSCGSYHNNSYYDSDGIYSGSRQYASEVASYQTDGGKAGSYFTQFQDYHVPQESEGSVGIFTDVDSYYGEGSGYSTGYSGWGNNTNDVTVNVYGGGLGWGGWYGNWGWGGSYWNYGWGWNSWHNPYWGWGWNSWYSPYWGGWNHGWGGGYYPYYGNSFYHGGYAYNRGPRGYYSSSDYAYRSRTMRQQGSATRSVGQNRAYEVRGRGEGSTPTRSDSRFTTSSTRSNTLGNNTRGGNSTRNSAINNSRSTNNQNSTINNSRGVNQNRNSTINNNRSSNSNTINNNRGSNNNSNRSGSFNNSTRSSSGSPSMNRGGSSGGGRSSGMGGGGGSRSSGGGRR